MTELQAIDALKFNRPFAYTELQEAVDVAIQALEEIQQYRAIGLTPQMVKDLIASEKKAHKVALENADMLDEYRAIGTPTQIYEKIGGLDVELGKYRAIGTVEEFKALKEKSEPKKPKYQKIKYGKHKWRTDEKGEVDEFAWESGYCNGVVCEVCGQTECIFCNPDYDKLKDCEMEFYRCPSCNEKVSSINSHCKKCNQKIGW